MANFEQLWHDGLTFNEFLTRSTKHRDLWDGLYNLATIPQWALDAVPPDSDYRLLVIAEDWCGDASSTVPIVAKWSEMTGGVSLRIVGRDDHTDLMDEYLTNGSRSIPIVIVLDHAWNELGHWGPRPRVLQQWVMANRTVVPKEEFYPQVRKWYARDRGESTLREVIEAIGKAGER